MSVPLLKKGLLGGGSKILLFLRPNQLSLNLFPKTTGILGMEFVPFVIISIKTKKMCDNFPPLSFSLLTSFFEWSDKNSNEFPFVESQFSSLYTFAYGMF